MKPTCQSKIIISKVQAVRIPFEEASVMKRNRLLLEKVMVDILNSWKEPRKKFH